MEATSTSLVRRRWYQFSLREILLATVAISAVLANIVNYRSFAPTEFFEKFDEHRMLRDLNRKHRLGISISSNDGATFRGDRQSFRSYRCSISPSDYRKTCRQLMPQLHAAVEQLLADTDCQIYGHTTQGTLLTYTRPSEPRYQEITEFSFNYKSGNVRGKIKVSALEGPDGETQLRIETDEW